jgi:hypothetical protein
MSLFMDHVTEELCPNTKESLDQESSGDMEQLCGIGRLEMLRLDTPPMVSGSQTSDANNTPATSVEIRKRPRYEYRWP